MKKVFPAILVLIFINFSGVSQAGGSQKEEFVQLQEKLENNLTEQVKSLENRVKAGVSEQSDLFEANIRLLETKRERAVGKKDKMKFQERIISLYEKQVALMKEGQSGGTVRTWDVLKVEERFLREQVVLLDMKGDEREQWQKKLENNLERQVEYIENDIKNGAAVYNDVDLLKAKVNLLENKKQNAASKKDKIKFQKELIALYEGHKVKVEGWRDGGCANIMDELKIKEHILREKIAMEVLEKS